MEIELRLLSEAEKKTDNIHSRWSCRRKYIRRSSRVLGPYHLDKILLNNDQRDMWKFNQLIAAIDERSLPASSGLPLEGYGNRHLNALQLKIERKLTEEAGALATMPKHRRIDIPVHSNPHISDQLKRDTVIPRSLGNWIVKIHFDELCIYTSIFLSWNWIFFVLDMTKIHFGEKCVCHCFSQLLMHLKCSEM